MLMAIYSVQFLSQRRLAFFSFFCPPLPWFVKRAQFFRIFFLDPFPLIVSLVAIPNKPPIIINTELY